MKWSECKKKIPCVDCDDTTCAFQGRKDADCPDIQCHRPERVRLDCDHCRYIDEIIENIRKMNKEET